MISIMGFLLYGIVFFSAYKLETIRSMLEQAMLLAPELSTGMFTLYCYPLILSLFLKIARKRSAKHAYLLRKQTNISASVAVSLGLIGTFLGLTAMVSAIASSMGGDGDMADRMGSMLGAISEALSAMSYAFLTSILGVGVSVLLILSLNFWMFGFDSEEKSEDKNAVNEAVILEHLVKLTRLFQDSYNKIDKLLTDEKKSELLISSLQEINTQNKFIYDDFIKTMKDSSDFQNQFLDKISSTEKINTELSIIRKEIEETKIIHKEQNEKLSFIVNETKIKLEKVKSVFQSLSS